MLLLLLLLLLSPPQFSGALSSTPAALIPQLTCLLSLCAFMTARFILVVGGNL
jgi:hypothetical protein